MGIRRGVGEGSALPPKADIRQRIEHVCFVPIATVVGYGERGSPDFRSGDTEAAIHTGVAAARRPKKSPGNANPSSGPQQSNHRYSLESGSGCQSSPLKYFSSW